MQASRTQYLRPRLWIRLCECCLQHHQRQQQRKDTAASGSDMVRQIVGRGSERRGNCVGVNNMVAGWDVLFQKLVAG
jgi:hypothetical protein